MEQREHGQLYIPQDTAAESPAKHRECEPSTGRYDVLCDVYGEHSGVTQIWIPGTSLPVLFAQRESSLNLASHGK